MLTFSDDGGATFHAPLSVGTGNDLVSCSFDFLEVEGKPTVVWTQDGEEKTSRIQSFDPETLAFGPQVVLGAPLGEKHYCARLAAAPNGKLALVRREGPQQDGKEFITVQTSEGGLAGLSEPENIEMPSTAAYCPRVQMAPSGTLHLLWYHHDQSWLTYASRKRPCE